MSKDDKHWCVCVCSKMKRKNGKLGQHLRVFKKSIKVPFKQKLKTCGTRQEPVEWKNGGKKKDHEIIASKFEKME